MRRLERALLIGDPDIVDYSPRAQWNSLAAGALLTVLMLAAAAVSVKIVPVADIGDAAILRGRDSGALYVRIGDTVHPVANLTSARLITGANDRPRIADDSALATVRRGPAVGIPGAPDSLGTPLAPADSAWTVCDADGTTVIGGPVGADSETRVLTPDAAVVATGPSGTSYLLFNGRRAVLDVTDPAVVSALSLDAVPPKPVSSALLSVVPEVPPITVPRIADRGAAGPEALPGRIVGDIVRVEKSGADEYFVVLAGGVQRVGSVAVDLLRAAAPRPGSDFPVLDPSLLRRVPTVGTLPVAAFPDRIRSRHGGDLPAVCAAWTADGVSLLGGPALPLDGAAPPVPLAQADGAGPAIDAVSVPPGRSVYVRAPGGAGSVITGAGARFDLGDPAAAGALGLPGEAAQAPWPLLRMLPTGPVLSRRAALVARDVLPGSVTAEAP